LARTTGEKVIAAAVVERVLPAGVDPIESNTGASLRPGRPRRSNG
jgi:hypothetical protein